MGSSSLGQGTAGTGRSGLDESPPPPGGGALSQGDNFLADKLAAWTKWRTTPDLPQQGAPQLAGRFRCYCLWGKSIGLAFDKGEWPV